MPQAPSVALPKRLPLIAIPSNRGITPDKDARLINGYVEQGASEGEVLVYKRPGLTPHSATSSVPAGTARGCYNWLGDIYSITGSLLYKNNTSIGTVDTTNGQYRFTQTLGATPRLVLGNGVEGYTYDGATFANIVDADFPAAFVKGWGFLNATTYLSVSSAHILGSDLNDPTAWDPLNDILAYIEPDLAVATAKHLVYILCLKQWSVEVFYDAGNTSGSALGRVEGAKSKYGCRDERTLRNIDDRLCWVSTTKEGAVQVVKFENTRAEVVSTKPIERILSQFTYSSATIYSWSFRAGGHGFYGLTVGGYTFVYDLDERLWSQWWGMGLDYMPIVDSTYTASGVPLVQGVDGLMYEIAFNVGTDTYSGTTTTIVTDLYTPNFDGGVQGRGKQLSMLYVIADQTAGSLLKVRSNDWDYAASRWTNFRTIDLSRKEPCLANEGSFHRRAYHFRHDVPTAFRCRAIELQMDLCTL